MGRKALDVLKGVCDQLGWSQIVSLENEDTLTKDDRKLVRALNRTLRVLSGVQDWRFLRKEGEIITTAEYTDGVARLTNGSTAVTGLDDPNISGTLAPTWTTAMVGRAFVALGDPLVYRITAVNSATSLTLSRAWQGATTLGTADDPDRNYKILQDRYDLPADMDRPVDDTWTLFKDTVAIPMRIVDAGIVRDRRRTRVPSASVEEPEVVTLWESDPQGEHRVAVLDPFPRDQRVVTFEYQAIHPVIDRDVQRIQFPPRYEEVVAQGVEYLLRKGPDDDARTDLELGEFLRARAEACSAREIGQQRMRITPSVERALHERFKRHSRGRRIDWGSRFDRADFYDL